MSRGRGEVPDYGDFRTGLSFRDVRELLAREAWTHYQRTGTYMFVGRSTVLGRWRQLKLQMYEQATGGDAT